MTSATKVLLVEDGLRSKLRTMAASAQLNVVAGVGFGVATLVAVRQYEPDVVLLSLEEPITPRLMTIDDLLRLQPNLAIIVVTALSGPAILRKAALAGARDFLVQPVDPAELRRAVGIVAGH